ncbi:Thaumatin-like protein 1, partial [Bienertia sinuspersici]
AAKFRFTNKCRHTIWPGLLSGATSPPLPTTGFSLSSGKSRSFTFPKSWSGRIWARTFCSGDPSAGKLVCLTGDCASGKLQCSGAGAIPPATLAEFTLNGAGGLDFYDVSLVDGYNLPVLIVPRGGRGGDCSPTGCLIDLNHPRYCCSEGYDTPDTCPPSVYSLFFKEACPRAYSYAYDDKTSTFTCAAADYIIVFCPPPYTR